MVAALLLACTSPPDGTDPSDTATSTTFPEYEGVVEGVLLGADDQPLAGVDITLCGGVCQVTTPSDDGSFRFEGVWPQVQVLETLTYPGDDPEQDVLAWSRFFDLLPVGDAEHVVLDRVAHVHPVETQRELVGPQQLTLADGLEVAFDADVIGIEHPLPYPATQVALGATELPPADWPTATGDWTVLRAWTLAVWDLEATDAFAVTAALPSALPPGTEVAFLVADYVHGFREGTLFEEAAVLSPDGLLLRTPVDGGLDRTTLWVAAARLEAD